MTKSRFLFLSVAMLLCCGLARGSQASSEAYRLISNADEIVAILDNGMTVIVRRVVSPAVAVRIYVRTGSIYEGRWLGGGLSHLLEHLVAGGSTEDRTEAENRNLLQEIGNNSNAYTSADHTCYFINTTPEHLDKAVDLLAGWMLRAKITPEEFAREYQVVQRELEMGKGEPDRVFWKLLNENRYRISPARVPVIGYQHIIQSLTRDDVYNYYKQAYQPGNFVAAVTGDIDPETMLITVKKHFATARSVSVFSHQLPQEPPVLTPRMLSATMPRLGQARLDLGFPSIRLSDPDLYALDLLAAVLGSGESSILVEEIRDRQRLVSSISCSSFTPDYVEGTFRITMELDPDKIEQATTAVLEQLRKLQIEPIDPQRIARAKTQIRAWRIRNMQTAEQIAASLATDYLDSGDPHFSQEYVERIARVTAEQLQQVARKYLQPDKLLTTILLPEQTRLATAPSTTRSSARWSVSRIELDNGLILLHKQIPTTPLVEVRMFALGGLTAEDQQTNGLGNFVMEMLPRGTTSRSARQIAEFFDSIGGSLETACGNNTWYWTMTCLKDDFASAMEVWADVVNNPAFPESEIPAVRQRILAAIQSQDDDWHSQAMRFFRSSFFGPSHSPYQFLSVGQKEVVEQATADQLRQWYIEKILPSRRVLAIFGDVDLEQAKSLAARLLGRGAKIQTAIERPETQPPLPAEGTPAINVARIEVLPTRQPLAGIVIGFESGSIVGQDWTYALNVLDTMASGWGYPTGYLHETLRGQGLVYVVHAADMPGRDASLPGTFLVYAGCDPKNVNRVVDLILQNIARCQGSDQDMQQGWFARAKQLILTADAIQLQTPSQQATSAALDELYGLGYDYHERFAEKIGQVTLQQVRQVARSRLRQCVVTVCTPMPELVDRQTGLREYPSFPPVELTPRGVQHEMVR